jgi:hypothetical protein
VLQATAQPTGLDPYHRVGRRIETWVAAKDINCDGVGLDPVGIPGKRFLHNKLEKALLPVGSAEFVACNNTLERGMDEMRWKHFVGIV